MKIRIKVKPNSKKEKIEKVGASYIINVKEPAREGKANARVIKMIAKEFGISSKDVKLKGLSSRNKVVEVN